MMHMEGAIKQVGDALEGDWQSSSSNCGDYVAVHHDAAVEMNLKTVIKLVQG